MEPPKTPTAPPAEWNPEEIQVSQKPPQYEDPLPPPYEDYNAVYNPLPGGHSRQSGYPQGVLYGPGYGQPYEDHQIVTFQPVVYVTSNVKPERDYLCCSVFTMLCCCIPLGIAALIFSIKTRDANLTGNIHKAKKDARTACALNSAGVVIGASLMIVYVLVKFINTLKML